MPVREVALRITNSFGKDLTVHLEPWGEQYRMEAGATFNVQAKGPDVDTLEIEYGDGKITVFGWSGSVVTISANVKGGEN